MNGSLERAYTDLSSTVRHYCRVIPQSSMRCTRSPISAAEADDSSLQAACRMNASPNLSITNGSGIATTSKRHERVFEATTWQGLQKVNALVVHVVWIIGSIALGNSPNSGAYRRNIDEDGWKSISDRYSLDNLRHLFSKHLKTLITSYG